MVLQVTRMVANYIDCLFSSLLWRVAPLLVLVMSFGVFALSFYVVFSDNEVLRISLNKRRQTQFSGRLV